MNDYFFRDIATFIALDDPDDATRIGVQTCGCGCGFRAVLVNNTAVSLDDVGALIDAILEAKAVAAGDLKLVA